MNDTSIDAFTEYLLERAGPAVRSVASYDADGTEIHFIRDDVAEAYEPTTIEAVMTNLRKEGEIATREEHLYAHGELNCLIRCFEGGLEMHFPYGESEGLAVALEASAAKELYDFVEDCLTELTESRRE